MCISKNKLISSICIHMKVYLVLIILLVFSCNQSKKSNNIASSKRDTVTERAKESNIIDEYQQDDNYFVVTFDINNDGKEDKIISNKPNKGNSLLVYFSKGAGYVLKLESINFSQDGGHQIKKIEKNNKGFTIITAFPKGTDKYSYFISHENNSFILSRGIHEVILWQNDPNKKRVCVFEMEINLNKSASYILNNIINAEEKANCTSEPVINN